MEAGSILDGYLRDFLGVHLESTGEEQQIIEVEVVDGQQSEVDMEVELDEEAPEVH
jgi:hypothetical protein